MARPISTIRQSMTTRLLMLCVLIFGVFGGVLVIMVSAFGNIENLTNKIITKDVNRILQNAQRTRDLSGILSETNLLVSTFYGHDILLDKKKKLLVNTTEGMLGKEMEETQRNSLREFRVALIQLLEKCSTMNSLQGRVLAVDKKLHEFLTQLEETVSQKIIDLVLTGEDSRAYEQTGALIPSYRESLLQSTLSFSRLEPAHEYKGDISKIIEFLDNLHLRLRTLLASDQEVSAYGRKLLAGIIEYRQAIFDFQRERQELHKRLAVLNNAKEQTMAAIQDTDDQSVHAVQMIKQEIVRITGSSMYSVLIITGFVAILFAVFTYFFLLYHIRKPMELIRRGIVSVSEGNLQTRIELGREDEWNIIENALNRMFQELGDSYEKLQTNNEEIGRTHREI